ncbi:MAG TPA: hypothetical protein ENO22_14315 [candidate division Zixibacteria bacterium]|nr:hypothetical protein [candidate division Zixibacteria bacterium]HER00507.1 hypothetical protein [candidate division Zixibacteria bacterium]
MLDFLSFENAITAFLGLVVAFIGKKYLLPLLEVESRRKYAEWIAHIADELTDDLVARYPDNRWVKFIDDSVDKLMEICGIEKEVAARAINSALRRKSLEVKI